MICSSLQTVQNNASEFLDLSPKNGLFSRKSAQPAEAISFSCVKAAVIC